MIDRHLKWRNQLAAMFGKRNNADLCVFGWPNYAQKDALLELMRNYNVVCQPGGECFGHSVFEIGGDIRP